MFYKTIMLCLFGYVLVECADELIEFHLKDNQVGKQKLTVSCDHTYDNVKTHFYTAMEKENIRIKIPYGSMKIFLYINHISCVDNINKSNNLLSYDNGTQMESVVSVTKNMGTVWKCSIYTQKDSSQYFQNTVFYKDGNYLKTDCYMRIHVRPKIFAHNILINYMKVDPVRTDSSEKHVDFDVVYNYADGDNITVTCTSQSLVLINMQYDFADKFTNAFNTSRLISDNQLNFRTKLQSKHNNTDIICTFKDMNDYTNVRIKFISQMIVPSILNIIINGVTLRQKQTCSRTKVHFISTTDVILTNVEPVHLICETSNDWTLKFLEYDINETSLYRNTTDTNVRVERYLTLKQNATCKCIAMNTLQTNYVINTIRFTVPQRAIETCQIKMDVSPNNIVMELTEGNNKILYHKIEHYSVPVKIKCYTYCAPGVNANPFVYLQLNDTDDQTDDIRKLNLFARENDMIVCSKNKKVSTGYDVILERITVIFNKKVETATTRALVSTLLTEYSQYWWKVLIIILLVVSIIAGAIVLVKRCCCKNTKQVLQCNTGSIDPNRFYLNLEVFRQQYENELERQESLYEEVE